MIWSAVGAATFVNTWDAYTSAISEQIIQQGKPRDSDEYNEILEASKSGLKAAFNLIIAVAVIDAFAFIFSVALRFIVHKNEPVSAPKPSDERPIANWDVLSQVINRGEPTFKNFV